MPCSVLIIVVADSGEVHAVKDNVAMSFEVLSKILKWKQTGASQHDALKRLITNSTYWLHLHVMEWKYVISRVYW